MLMGEPNEWKVVHLKQSENSTWVGQSRAEQREGEHTDWSQEIWGRAGLELLGRNVSLYLKVNSSD